MNKYTLAKQKTLSELCVKHEATIEKLERERNELAAQVERLRGALAALEFDAKACADNYGLNVYADLCESAANACRILEETETQAQSLEAVKREAAICALEDYEAALSSFEMTVPEYIKARLS